MNKYLLGGHEIDVERGEIRKDEQVVQLEPKVMQVLGLLVAHQGQVVSQEYLFEQVWPGSVVTAGTLQRCIGLLRKALDDDAKRQGVIVTHPKRGYSLALTPQSIEPKKSKNFARVWLAIVVMLLASVAWWLQTTGEQVFTLQSVAPLTSASKNERWPQLSPDQAYLAFVRESEANSAYGHIWVQDRQTFKTWQLSEVAENIRSLSWARDGRAIWYSTRDVEGAAISRIDLISGENKRLHNNQSWRDITSLVVTQANTLWFVAHQEGGKSVLTYDWAQNQFTELAELSKLTQAVSPYALTMNKAGSALAVLGFTPELKTQVWQWDMQTNQGERLANLKAKVYSADWQANGEALIISDGQSLQQLSLQGKLTPVAYEQFAYLSSVSVSNDGQHILVTSERGDSDLWEWQATGPVQPVVDSRANDWGASVSPDGTYLAYISERQGYPQIWVKHQQTQTHKLVFTNPDKALSLAVPVWDSQSLRLASATNFNPFIISLTGERADVIWPDNLSGEPLQWLQQDRTLLLQTFDGTSTALHQFDLQSLTMSNLANIDGGWAHVLDEKLLQVNQRSLYLLTPERKLLHNFEDEILNSIHNPQGLFIQTRAPGRNLIWHLAAAEDTPLLWQRLPDDNQVLWAMDHQQKVLVVETEQRSSEILMLTAQSPD